MSENEDETVWLLSAEFVWVCSPATNGPSRVDLTGRIYDWENLVLDISIWMGS